MADREYSITIEVKGGVDGKNSPISGDNGSNTTDDAKSGGFLSKGQAKDFGKALTAYHFAKSFTDQIFTHEVSMVELRTGSGELQQRANFNLEVGQKIIGGIESIAVGAAVGGLPGALLGMTTSAAHWAISYNQKVETLNTQRTLENQSIQMNYIRAGASGSRR
jgi:hypothetical protein